MMNSKIKLTVTLQVERPVYGGVSIGRHEGKVVMIQGAPLAGETVEVVIDSERKDYFTGTVRRILEPSQQRVKPVCKFFGICGGCYYQHIPYDMQVQIKQEILRDCLRRLGKLEINISEPILGDSPWNYRHRGQFKVARKGMGFYRENTRHVVDIDQCPVMTEDVNKYFHKAKQLLKTHTAAEECHITVGDSAVILLKTGKRQLFSIDPQDLASSFVRRGFSGVVIENRNKKLHEFGTIQTIISLNNLSYVISPASFFQSNWGLNSSIIQYVQKHTGPLSGKMILDLYAGAGNFSLPLAKEANIVAVEENEHSIRDGKRALEINNISNVRFVHSPAEEYEPDGHFDIVVLDPPRKGLAKSVVNRLLSMLPEKVVYISCNPTTLARDLRELSSRYQVDSVRLVDFFPQTYHIESLTFLSSR